MSNFSDFAGGGGGLEIGDVIVSARPLASPEFISQPGLFLKSDFPLIGNLAPLSTSGAIFSSVTSGFGSTDISSVDTDGNGVWVAVGNNSIATRSTDNGVTWSSVTTGIVGFAAKVRTDKSGVWVATGNSGAAQRSTDNGVNWSSVTTGMSAFVNALATDGSGTWIAAGGSAQMSRSVDNGATWSTVTSDLSAQIFSVATDRDGVWVAVGNSGQMSRSVDNGLNWTNISFRVDFSTIRISGVFYEKDIWVAVGNAGLVAVSKTNGFYWALVNNDNGPQGIRGVSASDDGVWLIGGFNQISRSNDNALNFFGVDNTVGETNVNEIAYGNGVWIAVANGGSMNRSAASATEFFVSDAFANAPRYLFTGETA